MRMGTKPPHSLSFFDMNFSYTVHSPHTIRKIPTIQFRRSLNTMTRIPKIMAMIANHRLEFML